MSDTKNLVRVRSGVQSYVEATPDEIGAVALASVGAPSGVAGLDSTGRIPSGQLPSYVDDVLEFANFAAFPAIGESGKIYIAISPGNICYRWGGTVYAEISPSLALGETSATAYRGDRGKTAYDHSQVTGSNPHGTTASQVGAIARLVVTGAVDFDGISGGTSYFCQIAASSATNAPSGFMAIDGGRGFLIHGAMESNWVTQTLHTPSAIFARSMVSAGVWSPWRSVGLPSLVVKSTSYDFTGITASLIKHANGDVIGTLSGGVPGQSYTVVSVASMILGIPSGVTLYGTSSQWAGPSSFTLGGMRPITIQCLSSTEWLIPSYGE